MATLAELIASLDDFRRNDRYEPAPIIYARRPWTLSSEATVLYGERSVEPASAPGFVYLLEVELATDAIEVWSIWRDGRTPTLAEAVGAVIWYAEHDAYEPTDNSAE
jgi:hypothetical protein